jgi:diguanylate cyclase (GGDEF)-like protein/PAS domain S-box-containing protein
MISQWAAAVILAVLVSPLAWTGAMSQVHVHVWTALLLGGAIASLPVALAMLRPGEMLTRHVIAVSQMLMGAMLIHLTGGRIETHFHVFGSLAFLAFYRDWRVLLTASAIVAVDHFLRGMFWPQSVFGILRASSWRWAEHAGWVVFEDIFLIRSCALGIREMRAIAGRQALLEATRDGIDRTVRERTAELQQANIALRRGEERFRVLCTSSPIGIFTTNVESRCTYLNPRCPAIGGFSQDAALGATWTSLIPFENDDRFAADWLRAMCTGSEFEGIYRVHSADHGVRWVYGRSAPMRDDRGELVGHVGTLEDITERKLAEERLAHQATHDALTGLPNRVLLLERLDRELQTAMIPAEPFALLLIDLDRFKEINDTFGHASGDAVLRQLSPLLSSAVSGTDTVARLGGDEFGVLLPGANRSRAEDVARSILARLEAPLLIEGQPLEISLSVGIALSPDHGSDVTTLMQRADVAMYAAKRAHAGSTLYADHQAEYTPRRLAMVHELRIGLESDQLILHYQPKINLTTCRVHGVEALIRWVRPGEGLVGPDDFIPIAEHTGLIRPLGLWTLHTAHLQHQAWLRSGIELNIAVNLAAESLQDEGVVEVVRRMVEDSRASWLTIEVTESAVMSDPARAKTILTRLHELGVRISIDDFGTGYSSLAYLKELPVDEVKVDRSFVKEMATNERDACIVRSVIDLGHNLGLNIVAEGVEDPLALDLLRAWGCDLAQGFYFSKPLSPAELLAWITSVPEVSRLPALGALGTITSVSYH